MLQSIVTFHVTYHTTHQKSQYHDFLYPKLCSKTPSPSLDYNVSETGLKSKVSNINEYEIQTKYNHSSEYIDISGTLITNIIFRSSSDYSHFSLLKKFTAVANVRNPCNSFPCKLKVKL